MAFNIADLFERAVDAVPDRTALIVGDRRLTYRQLDEAANRIGHHLGDAGVGPGDHVGIHAENSTEWVEAMLGIFKIRAVPININYRYVAEELAYLFDDADLVALVHARSFAPLIAEVRHRVPALRHFVAIDDGTDAPADLPDSIPWADAVAGASSARDFGERSADDHYVLYTGGTTGMPKGVVWRHEDVFFALGGGIEAYTNHRVESDAELAAKARATESPGITLCVPPLMHGAAQWATLRFFFEGGTVVLAPRFEPAELWASVEREGVHVCMITGDAMGRPLIEAFEAEPDRWDVSSLMVVTSSGTVFSPTVKNRFFAALSNIMIIDSIGSSESGHNGSVIVERDKTAMTGGGPTVTALLQTTVLDDDLKPVEPGSGVIGRLARGGNIPIGYHKDEAKTAATFVVAADGERYVIPGDFATLEADGSITLLGRGSVCINSGGEKIYPEEVESALKDHPSVFDAVVVGVPDARWGEAVAAVVQARPDRSAPTLDDLDAHCRRSLAAYKVPRHLHLVEEVERSPAGKPDYRWAKAVATGTPG